MNGQSMCDVCFGICATNILERIDLLSVWFSASETVGYDVNIIYWWLSGGNSTQSKQIKWNIRFHMSYEQICSRTIYHHLRFRLTSPSSLSLDGSRPHWQHPSTQTGRAQAHPHTNSVLGCCHWKLVDRVAKKGRPFPLLTLRCVRIAMWRAPHHMRHPNIHSMFIVASSSYHFVAPSFNSDMRPSAIFYQIY